MFEKDRDIGWVSFIKNIIVNIVSQMSVLQYKIYNLEQKLDNKSTANNIDPQTVCTINALLAFVQPVSNEVSEQRISYPQK